MKKNPSLPDKNEARKKGLSIWVWIAGSLLIVLLGIGIYGFTRFNSFKDDTFGGRDEASLLNTTSTPSSFQPSTAIPLTTSSVQTTVAIVPTATPEPADPIVQKIRRGEKISLMLLGYGGGGHDGGYLTDTILQVIFDPAKKAVTMVSIPRDLWVFVPYGGAKVGYWGKINSAFSYVMETNDTKSLSNRYRYNPENLNSRVDAASILTKDIIESITGVPVDYWAVVSFDGFRQFINAIGGVYLNVEKTFDDYEYPRNDDPNIDPGYMHIHFDAGWQTLNGERAIEYSRSRHSLQDGNDFGRSKRQMNVIQAVKDKVTKPDILLKALPIMDALQGKIRTSLSFDRVTALASYFRSSEGSSQTSNVFFVPMVLSNTNYLTDSNSDPSIYYLEPIEGEGNYKAIQAWVRTALLYPEIKRENLTLQVQNATGLSKPGVTATTLLKGQGLTVLEPQWATSQLFTEIVDYTNGKGVASLKALRNIFPTVPITQREPPVKGYTGPDVVIVLGKDYSKDNSFDIITNTDLYSPAIKN
ncbi:LCP family protein [Candidatus Chlorohelix sp.]|uniref:LCP family protein n=1 Tax=Candidatus Chlorohelix sp. TaxID=3139201 RepID=UPI0030357761